MDAVAERQHASREMRAQPLDVVNVPGAWLNVRTVEILVGWGKTKINTEIKAGRFPAPQRPSPTCSRWLSDDIRAYMEARKRGACWVPAKGT